MKAITQYLIESKGDWEWEDEANKDGKLEVTTNIFVGGGRESYETNWEIEQLSDEGDYWNVRATVVNTELSRKYKKGWYIDFDLYKATSIWDIESVLLDAIEDEQRGAWSSGH